mgnify:FL=1
MPILEQEVCLQDDVAVCMAVLWVCFDNHADDGLVWAVREGNVWHRGAEVDIRIPLESVYRGPRAPQPRAYFRGHGTVEQKNNVLILTAE